MSDVELIVGLGLEVIAGKWAADMGGQDDIHPFTKSKFEHSPYPTRNSMGLAKFGDEATLPITADAGGFDIDDEFVGDVEVIPDFVGFADVV